MLLNYKASYQLCACPHQMHDGVKLPLLILLPCSICCDCNMGSPVQGTGKGQHTNLLIPDILKPSSRVLKQKALFGDLSVTCRPRAHLLDAFIFTLLSKFLIIFFSAQHIATYLQKLLVPDVSFKILTFRSQVPLPLIEKIYPTPFLSNIYILLSGVFPSLTRYKFQYEFLLPCCLCLGPCLSTNVGFLSTCCEYVSVPEV